MPQVSGSLWNHVCHSPSECPPPASTSSDGHAWTKIEFRKIGAYAVCYCDSDCGSPARWDFVARLVVPGPRSLYADTPAQGAVVSAGARFDLVLLGEGLSAGDRLAFLPGDGSCAALAAGARPAAALAHAGAPRLPGSAAPGGLALLPLAGGGVLLVTAVPHGLVAGDAVRLANATARPGAAACPSHHAAAWGRPASRCTEGLLAGGVNVTAVRSSTEALLALGLSAEECAGLELSGARWQATSREAFEGASAARGARGPYTICWGQDVATVADYTARAGVLEVLEPASFRSSLHLASAAPGVATPSILAFELGNHEAYSAATGPMGLRVAFRDVSRFRHSFSSAALRMSPSLAWADARPSVCGLLFHELWSDAEDGFPQPLGCFYDEAAAEYGMVFSPRAGLRAGARYQIVSPTELAGSVGPEHEWLTVRFAAPDPAFAPEEVRLTAPRTWGDVGAAVSEDACREACDAVPRCNVAVYRLGADRHCLLADFSARRDPYATAGTRAAGRADLTMFMVDRLNASSASLAYRGAPPEAALLDLRSYDDLALRPSHVLEASAAAAQGGAGLAAAGPGPRWHREGGLRILGAAEGAAIRLAEGASGLAFALRAAPGSRIEAGAVVRLLLRPLTQWSLGPACRAEHAAGAGGRGGGGHVACRPEPLVTSPWVARRNSLRLVLPPSMDAITDRAVGTLQLHRHHFPLPGGGFLPTRLAAEVRSERDASSPHPHVDYTVSTGALMYATVTVAGALYTRDGNSRPFAGDVGNVLLARLRLGSVVRAGPSGLAYLTLRLPVGYACQAARLTSGDLRSLAAVVAEGPHGHGELEASGEWSFAGNDCMYRLPPNAVIYAGSSLAAVLSVSNPATPMMAEDASNTWAVSLTAPGDGGDPVPLGASELAGDAHDPRLPRNVAVLGRLSYASLTPTSSWWAAPRNLARVFFGASPASAGRASRIRLGAPPGFSFHTGCQVHDLPWQYYRPYQSPYSHGMTPTAPLGAKRVCHAVSEGGLEGGPPDVAEIQVESELAVGVVYGFAVQVLHSLAYEPREGAGFVLATFARSGTQPIDKATAMPLLQATRDDAWPSYGLYAAQAGPDVLQVLGLSRLPYAYTARPSDVVLLLRPPLDSNSTDHRVRLYSSQVSWRVFAPDTYVWDFSRANFFYRRSDVEHGTTADLPIQRAPQAPEVPPLNRIDFPGQDEHHDGWRPGQLYGFRAAIRVPAETPRHAVNEWWAEWGFDRRQLARRACAASAGAGEVRTLHSVRVRSLGGGVRGRSDELLFQLGTATAIPAGRGALVVEAPPGFAFEAACVPFAPRAARAPYLPVPARLDCAASEAASPRLAGALRPVVTLRPLDAEIPAGMWAFVLACVNPGGTLAGVAGTFLLHSYASYTDEGNSDGANEVADVGAVLAGFEVREEMPFAGIVRPADYALSGRDDHPGQSSLVVLAFELRRPPATAGDHDLLVLAPEGFAFLDPCRVDIGSSVFGRGQAFPSPCVPFEAGVRLLSCTGDHNEARARVTPGLRQGRRYAFRVRVDRQPALTPAQNEWRLAYGSEASASIAGYRLWAFDDMALTMSRRSRLDEAAPVDGHVDLYFTPTNPVPMRGMLLVIAPQGYRMHLGCGAELLRLGGDAAAAPVRVPNAACIGEQPPTNRAQVRFRSELAFIVAGARHRLTLTVSNPPFLAAYDGFWTLQSFSEASDDPAAASLLDVGRVPSLPVTERFEVFVVEVSGVVGTGTLHLPLEVDMLLPRPLGARDVLDVVGPPGYDFATPVADVSLQGDLRQCLLFEPLPAPEAAGPPPAPLCAGRTLRFRPRGAPGAARRLRFRTMTEWPRESLSSLESTFRASLLPTTGEPGVLHATALALLAPITPRLLGFELTRRGKRADAVSSVGTVRISFNVSQAAQAIDISTRLDASSASRGVSFAAAEVEVHAAEQLLKGVASLLDGPHRFVLAFELAVRKHYVLLLRGVANPEAVGPVLWTLRTHVLPVARGGPGGAAAAGRGGAAAALPPTEFLQQLGPGSVRDEMVDWLAMRTVGRVRLAGGGAALEERFFDFPDTRVSFTVAVESTDAAAGQRFLVFPPAGWGLAAGSFSGGTGFPHFLDLGLLSCFDALVGRSVLLYAVRLLEPIRSKAPCELDPTKDCPKEVSFSLQAGTPATPSDLGRWRRESDQSWLMQIDAHASNTCGPGAGDALDPSLLMLTNDALFGGFDLKESITGMAVVPEPNGRLSGQRTTVEVGFETRSPLELDASSASPGGLFLRLLVPDGVVFDSGCLAAVPDPDYSSCTGEGRVALLRIRGGSFAPGRHQMLLRVANPARTPSRNRWSLESFVGVGPGEARAGRFEAVRQRGQAAGYEILQGLAASLRPSSTEAACSVVVFLWLRPSVYVGPRGYVELHAPEGFGIGCEPAVVLLAMPTVQCRASTGGPADIRASLELQLDAGGFLLPNGELELGVHGRNPGRAAAGAASPAWGVRLRGAGREVLESNMELPPYALTGSGLSVASLTPSTTAPYARSEVRLLVGFSRRLSLAGVSELKVLAPPGWDLQPLCSRFWDATGACGVRCEWQLPYSEERGHHRCPQPRVLLLLLDPLRAVRPAVYELLLGAVNPAAAPPRNLWRVSLLSFSPERHWAPAAAARAPEELRPGQAVLGEAVVRGFSVGAGRGRGRGPQALPLRGEYLETMSGGAGAPPAPLPRAALLLALAGLRGWPRRAGR